MENALWKGPGTCATDCMTMKNEKLEMDWTTMKGCNGGTKISGVLVNRRGVVR